MAFLGLEAGNWADWVSGLATTAGILYTIWLNNESKRPKIELSTYLESTKKGDLAAGFTEKILIYEVFNNSGTPIRIKRLGVEFTKDNKLKKNITNESVDLSENGHSFYTVESKDSYQSYFFFAWVDYFPKKDKFIRAYPYVVLKDGTKIKAKKGDVYSRNAFGFDRT